MAEGTEESEKTEDPTPKRLEDSRKKGQVPNSREVNHWFMMLAATIAVLLVAPGFFHRMGPVLTRFLAEAGTYPSDEHALFGLLKTSLIEVGWALLPLLGLFVAAALGAGLIQNGLIISGDPVKPKLEKISLGKGVKRLFSMKAIVEFVKGLLKITLVGAVVVMVLMPKFGQIAMIASLSMPQVLDLLQSLAARMMIAVLSVISVITVLDVLYQRWEFMKSQRMSRHEIKEEMKQSEGDPQIKSRLRQIRMERARQRMITKVPDADVVITNPTHYAVALAYDAESMAAPRVLAKGVDGTAQRIREVAEEHDIPLVENPPLARALFASAELDQEIPTEHYRAVAEIISYVLGLRKRASGAA